MRIKTKLIRQIIWCLALALFLKGAIASALEPPIRRSAARIQESLDELDLEAQQLEQEYNKSKGSGGATQSPPPSTGGEIGEFGISLLGERSEIPLPPTGSLTRQDSPLWTPVRNAESAISQVMAEKDQMQAQFAKLEERRIALSKQLDSINLFDDDARAPVLKNMATLAAEKEQLHEQVRDADARIEGLKQKQNEAMNAIAQSEKPQVDKIMADNRAKMDRGQP